MSNIVNYRLELPEIPDDFIFEYALNRKDDFWRSFPHTIDRDMIYLVEQGHAPNKLCALKCFSTLGNVEWLIIPESPHIVISQIKRLWKLKLFA